MAEWCNLPRELLDLISKRLDSSIDLLRFRSVCTSWRSSLYSHHSSPSSRIPILILPKNDISMRYDLCKRSIFFIQLPPTLSNSQSTPSWVIKIDQDNPQKCHLLNPLSHDEYNPLPQDFPRLLDFMGLRVCELGKEFTLRPSVAWRPGLPWSKVAFCDVGGGSYVFLTIAVGSRLKLLKSGDVEWTVIEDVPGAFVDVILYKGCFYAVDIRGRAVMVDVGGERVTVRFVADSVGGNVAYDSICGGNRKLLVDGCGELFMVDKFDRYVDRYDRYVGRYVSERTVRFQVFKLDKSGEKWIKVENLGDRIIFLGDHCAFSAIASDFVGCKGNCILFTNSNKVKSPGITVFDLESGSIGPLGNYPGLSELFWPPPAWISSPPNPVEAGLNHLRT